MVRIQSETNKQHENRKYVVFLSSFYSSGTATNPWTYKQFSHLHLGAKGEGGRRRGED